ncbi:MAG: RNA polymerase sigma factor [Clostridia bacterium]|nr:RNA polymerase sigma factor [Clostridia bacterium]
MDEAVFIDLCERQMASFYRMACSIVHEPADAEDAVQQALLNAWRARSRAKPGLERAWLMRIVINESLTLLRRRQRAIPTEDFPTLATPEDSGESAALHAAIRALPESLRTPLLLRYMEGMSEKEVAAALRLPLSSVKNRLFRARRKLQTMLNEEVSP